MIFYLIMSGALQVSELANQMQAEREGRVRAERSRQLAEQALEKLMNELDRMRAAEKTRSEMEDKFRQQVQALLCSFVSCRSSSCACPPV